MEYQSLVPFQPGSGSEYWDGQGIILPPIPSFDEYPGYSSAVPFISNYNSLLYSRPELRIERNESVSYRHSEIVSRKSKISDE